MQGINGPNEYLPIIPSGNADGLRSVRGYHNPPWHHCAALSTKSTPRYHDTISHISDQSFIPTKLCYRGWEFCPKLCCNKRVLWIRSTSQAKTKDDTSEHWVSSLSWSWAAEVLERSIESSGIFMCPIHQVVWFIGAVISLRGLETGPQVRLSKSISSLGEPFPGSWASNSTR